MGAVVPTYNLDEVKEPLKFTGPGAGGHLPGQDQEVERQAIKDLNRRRHAADKEIVVVHRSDGSGTTYIWVQIPTSAKISPEWKRASASPRSDGLAGRQGANGNEGVAGRVKAAPGRIGYIELIYALQNKVSTARSKTRRGRRSRPPPNVTAAAEGFLAAKQHSRRPAITICDAPGEVPTRFLRHHLGCTLRQPEGRADKEAAGLHELLIVY